MKKFILIGIAILLFSGLQAQDLPKEVQKVFDQAEKYHKKKNYDQALKAYKEVLRSMEHLPSLIAAGDVQFYRKPAQYRSALEFYTRALAACDAGISATDKKSVKKYLNEKKTEITPRRNKAQSHVDDFEKIRGNKDNGNRLLDDPDLED